MPVFCLCSSCARQRPPAQPGPAVATCHTLPFKFPSLESGEDGPAGQGPPEPRLHSLAQRLWLAMISFLVPRMFPLES